MPLALRLKPQPLFFLLAVSIYLVDSLACRMAADSPHRMLVAAGASFDLVLVVGLLYYWLLVRPGLRPRAGLVFVGALGLLRASFLFPEGVMAKAAVAGCAELGLIAYVSVQVARSRKSTSNSSDPLVALQKAVQAVIPFPAAANAVGMEMSIAYYALCGWRAKPHIPEGWRSCLLQEQSEKAFLFAAAGLASVFEIVPVHLLVHRWSSITAWILSAVSLYGMIWLLGLSRSLVLRPTLVGPESLTIRYGLIAQLEVPRDALSSVERVTSSTASVMALPRGAGPNVELTFTRPLRLKRVFGSRMVSRIALCVEDEGEFERALCDTNF
jgi:hypothetical protein